MRIALMVFRNIIIVPYVFFRLWWESKKYNGDYTKGFERAKIIAAHAIRGGNVTLEVFGQEFFL